LGEGKRSWVPIKHNFAWDEAYLPNKGASSSIQCLATTDMGRKLGGAVPLWGRGSWVTEAYLHAKFHLDPSNRFHNTPTLQTGRMKNEDRKNEEAFEMKGLRKILRV